MGHDIGDDAGLMTFRNLLEAGDVDGLRAHWAAAMPNMPQPETREAAEIVMHHARTQAESLPLQARAWSHRWLCERDLPSGLPDRLKPSAEQICPVVKTSVFLSINSRSPWMKPACDEVRKAMECAVEEIYADGRQEDAALLRSRMNEARDKTYKALFGRALA